jgi:hypothetical protein
MEEFDGLLTLGFGFALGQELQALDDGGGWR